MVVACWHGKAWVTCHLSEDCHRIEVDTPLEFLNAEVQVSQRSVFSSEGQEDSDGATPGEIAAKYKRDACLQFIRSMTSDPQSN